MFLVFGVLDVRSNIANTYRHNNDTVINVQVLCLFVCFWRDGPQWARASSFTKILDYTQRRTTVGRIPLDEWSVRRNTRHSQQTNVHAPGGIRTHDLSRWAAADLRLRPRGAATGTGIYFSVIVEITLKSAVPVKICSFVFNIFSMTFEILMSVTVRFCYGFVGCDSV